MIDEDTDFSVILKNKKLFRLKNYQKEGKRMNELQVFNFENNEVRTQIIDETLWFVGKDVSDILGYDQTSNMMKRIDKEDSISSKLEGMNMKSILINESGLYSAVIGSKLPNAKKFKRWVTGEVLPSIRKTGGYQVPTDLMSALKLMFQVTEETKEDIQDVKKRLVNLEENESLNPGEYNYVSKRISQRIFQIGRDRSYNMNKKQKAELFKALNSEIASITGVKTRSQLKIKHFDMVIDFIDDWEPSKATTVVVKQLELEGV